jgi:Na+/melibiose symporter-like transporter
MVAFLGHGNSAHGFQRTMGIFAVIGAILFIIAFASTKERIEPDPQQETSVLRDLGDLMKNGPWIALFVLTNFYFAALAIRGSMMMPYFKYCAGNEILFSWFNGYGLTAVLIGVACSTALTKRIGKKMLFFLSMVLTGILAIVLFFQSATNTVFYQLNFMNNVLRIPFGWVFVTEILRQFAFGCSGPVLWSMMADVADYGEWKTGRRATGTVISAVVFALWTGLALGGAIAPWLEAYFGYQANVAQTEHTLLGIRLIASMVSGAAFLAVALSLLFYRIDKNLNLTISNELAERRKGFSSNPS